MRPDTYEMTFTGRADKTLCAQFDDCNVTTGPDATTEEVTGAAHGDQQRTVALELSHRISLAGEAIVELGDELDIVSAEVAVRYVRKIIDRHRRPVIADLTTLSFCDARITGLDRRFLAFQVPEQAVGLRLP